MSDIIKGLRKMNGYTQEDVAKELGISPRTYWNKENNPSSFTVGEIKVLSKLLNVKEEIFFNERVAVTVT